MASATAAATAFANPAAMSFTTTFTMGDITFGQAELSPPASERLKAGDVATAPLPTGLDFFWVHGAVAAAAVATTTNGDC